MENKLSGITASKIQEKFDHQLFDGVNEFLSGRKNYFNTVHQSLSKWLTDSENSSVLSDKYLNTAALFDKIEDYLTQERIETEKKEIIQTIISAFKSVKAILSELPPVVTVPLDEAYFIPTDNDSALKKINKYFERNAYKTFKYFSSKRKNRTQEYRWKQNIPQTNLYKFYLLYKLFEQIVKEAEDLLENIGIIHFEYVSVLNIVMDKISLEKSDGSDKNFHDKFNNIFKELSEKSFSQINSLGAKFRENVSAYLHKLLLELESSAKVVDTLGNSIKHFSDKVILEEDKKSKQKFESFEKDYTNFFNGVFGREEFILDIVWFANDLIGNAFKLLENEDNYSKSKIDVIFENIFNALNYSSGKIQSSEKSHDKVISAEKEFLVKEIDNQFIVNIIDNISQRDLEGHIKSFSGSLQENLDQFSKDYQFIREKDLEFHIPLSDLKTFVPKELIKPIVINNLSSAFKNIEKKYNASVNSIKSEIIESARVIEFNMASSLAKLEQSGNSGDDEAKQIALNGLERSLNRYKELSTNYKNILTVVGNDLTATVKEALVDLTELTNIDKLIRLKLQASKDKAKQEAIEKFKSYYAVAKKYVLLSWRKIKFGYGKVKETITGISSMVGYTSGPTELSEAMADYLQKVSTSMERLPFVYKRLFNNDQVNDEKLFIGREAELEKFVKAYNHWDMQYSSSLVLVGEKGSGTSSLINIALQRVKPDCSIYRREFSKTIYTEEDLLTEMRTFLKMEDVNSFEAMIERLNAGNEKRIAIIENLEDFFLRIVGGFKALNKLFYVLTKTHNNVFWITTCNLFAWRFLQKTIQIGDYFIFKIMLVEMPEKNLQKIISVRHNISGYKLNYLADETVKKQKSFIKLSDSAKREHLAKIYFENLISLCSNNIAVALFLWLRSIDSFDENEITISPTVQMDFSFLKQLSDQKLFTLMAMILHDGLTIEEHSLVFNSNQKSSELLFSSLMDDGIIFKRGNSFKINFQLYMQIINLLKNKNILH
ncbi:MAG: hypothetical protein KKG93_20415 [Bacteroidetes bacterium]|nr:hypothetical protein [Bacteroidota bacterium]